jgi:hypothetical protein
MGISESILNRTIQCCEHICEDIDCKIKSCCCETSYSNNSPKRHHSKDSTRSDNSNISRSDNSNISRSDNSNISYK